MHITTLSVLALVAVAVQGFSYSIDGCPPNLVRNEYLTVYENWCFEFVFGRKYSYTDANDDCKINNGTLALVKDEGIQFFLLHRIQDYVNNYDQDYESLWIGLNDKVNEGTFVWEDGTNVTYSNWHQGEGPNRSPGKLLDCGAIDTFRGQWVDEHCGPDIVGLFEEAQRHYICQYEGDEGGWLGPSEQPPRR